jgi:hypothetical protein
MEGENTRTEERKKGEKRGKKKEREERGEPRPHHQACAHLPKVHAALPGSSQVARK